MGGENIGRQRLACLLCLLGPAGLLAFRVVDGIMRQALSVHFGPWAFGSIKAVLFLSQLLGVVGIAMLGGALRSAGQLAKGHLFRWLLICCGVLFILVILNYLIWLALAAGGGTTRAALFRLLPPARTSIFNIAFAICWTAALSIAVLLAGRVTDVKLKRGVQLLARITVTLLVLSLLLMLLCQFSFQIRFSRFSPQIGVDLIALLNWLFPASLLSATVSFATSLIRPKTKSALRSGGT